MFTVKSRFTTEEQLKKSRFIGVIAPCANEHEALEQLRQLYMEHPHANHIAFAYRLKTDQGLSYRLHDAGEPGGTAGKPIFQHLEGRQLINVVIAVVRYFGGIKLGAGGLTRAYGNSARQVIEAAELYPYVERIALSLTLDYSQLPNLEYLLKKFDGQIVRQDFAAQIFLEVQLPVEQLAALQQALPAGININI